MPVVTLYVREKGMDRSNLTLELLPHTYSICRLESQADIPSWALAGDFLSITRTKGELSLVCSQELVPHGVQCDKGWRCIMVRGPLDFSLIGILASLTSALAEVGISIFAISTFETDYLLVKAENLKRAVLKLKEEGHTFY
jgi:hypothetical protein